MGLIRPFRILPLFLLGLFISSTAYADGHGANKLTFKGNVWAKYTYITKEKAPEPRSGFDIYRSFLIASYKYDENWMATSTIVLQTSGTKVHLINNTASTNKVNLFSAFIKGKNVLMNDDEFTFGLIPNHFLGPHYKRFGTRFIATQLAAEAGYLASIQPGAGYKINFSKDFNVALQINNSDNSNGKNNDHKAAYVASLAYNFSDTMGLSLNYEKAQTVKPKVGATAATSPSQYVANATLHYVTDSFKLLLESAHRDTKDTASAEMGYGFTFLADIFDDFSYYTRYYHGNNEFRTDISAKHIFTTGPIFQINKKLKSSIIFESRPAWRNNPSIETFSFLMAASF